jgi:hypothetical protein
VSVIQGIRRYLTGVHLIGVYLMGVHLMGVYLMGVYLMGVYLMSLCLPIQAGVMTTLKAEDDTLSILESISEHRIFNRSYQQG